MKLFKKVAAAVLAGVMALSMVACGTTPVTPEKPVDPTASPEQQVMDTVNDAIATIAKLKGKKAVTIENSLKADAQKILDAVAAGKAEDTDDGVKITFKYEGEAAKIGAINDAMTAVDANVVYVDVAEFIAMDGPTNPVTNDTTNKKVIIELPEFSTKQLKLNQAKANALYAALMEADEDSDVKGQLKAAAKLGVASKTINNKTYVLIIVK